MRFRRRLLFLYVVFCVGIGLVWLRSAQMILVDGEEWSQRALERRQTTERLDAMRGPIVSADGVVLAEDVCQFQLAVVGWEWERRRRSRCTACGMVQFAGITKKPPRRCACPARLRRGGDSKRSDAYPRDDAPVGGTMEELPPGDLRPLEDALEVEPGTLARLANARVAEIEKIVDAYKALLAREAIDSEFLIDDKVRLRRSDLMLRPYVLIDGLSEEAVRLVQTDETGRFRGFRIQTALRRHYPLGDFAPQLLGFTSLIRSTEEYEALFQKFGHQITHSSRVGRAGIEKAHNGYLHGKTGRRKLQLQDGSFSKIVEYEPPVPGGPLRLALHARVTLDVQRILDEAAAKDHGYLPRGRPSGAFVALDADTGEVLVWAEAPRFDLNEDLKDLYDVKRQAIADEKAKVWEPRHPLEGTMDLETWRMQVVMPVPLALSRVAQVAVEPGSTFKPLIALGLLGAGRPISQEGMTCRHGLGMPGCHNCGTVYLEEAIARSCNRYFAWSLRNPASWSVNRRYVAKFIADLGLGQHPGEVAEWSAGQWLWNWHDFTLETAVAHADKVLAKRMGETAPKLRLGRHARVPATVGGDPKRLGRTLATVAEAIARRSGTRSVTLYASRHATEGRDVILQFGMRADTPRTWHLPPDLRQGADALPRAIRGWYPRNAGVQGRMSDRGTVWFNVRFERRVGRAGPGEPPVIRPDDGHNVGIGQGPVLATPLQMARAMAAIANGGTVVTPHVALQGARPLDKHDRDRVQIAAADLRRVRDGMFDAVDGGTARHAPWYEVPATVYGKTGTAQVGRSWRPWRFDEDLDAPWHHWFVGFAEAPGKRTIAFACVLHARTEDGAGLTAVPAVQRILARWYQEQD